MNRTRLIARYWLPVVAYATLIFYGSSVQFPEETYPSFIEGVSDKILHMVEYGLLGALCHRALAQARGVWAGRHALLLAIAMATAYGFSDELHQAFVPDREADVWDLLADAAGATIGAVAWHLVRRERDRAGQNRYA